MTQWHRFTSYAKINLGLYLINKRKDGYHNIATVFQQIDTHDTLSFQPVDTATVLTCTDSSIPTDERNLVLKACRLFSAAARTDIKMHIHLEKHIPAGGGLGGGSSNAAVALLACQELSDKKLNHEQLHKLAVEIGSDVPFFLKGGTALGLGRGEKLEPVDLPLNYHVLLINPGIHISTAEVYSHAIIGLTNEEKISKFRALLQKPRLGAWQDALNNELERVVFQKYPELQKMKHLLYARGAFYASLSGSGATLYGLYHDRDEAEKAQTFFAGTSGIRIFLSRPVSGPPCGATNAVQIKEPV